MVEGEGFEPSKAEPADLQSAPFNHSGIPPKNRSGNHTRSLLSGSTVFSPLEKEEIIPM